MILEKKSLKIILLLIISIFILTTNVFASATVDGIFKDADEFVSGDIDDTDSLHIQVEESSLQKLSNVVSNVLIMLGVFVAFIMAAILGINFMIQSTAEKAKIKEALIPFVIGLIVTFGAFGIWRIAIGLLSQV